MPWQMWVGVIGTLASMASLMALIFGPGPQKKFTAVALILLFAITAYAWIDYLQNPLLRDKVYTDGGNFRVDNFLGVISQGRLQVTMDTATSAELKQRNVVIRVQPLKNVSMKYVLDHVLLPQLPGPQQWEYEVIGTT